MNIYFLNKRYHLSEASQRQLQFSYWIDWGMFKIYIFFDGFEVNRGSGLWLFTHQRDPQSPNTGETVI